jgi:hypothetical protein
MLLAPFARTAKLVLERILLFVMDAILAVRCALTPPELKAMNESLVKAPPSSFDNSSLRATKPQMFPETLEVISPGSHQI